MKKKWIWILLAVILVIAIVVVALLWNNSQKPESELPPFTDPQATTAPGETPKPLLTPPPSETPSSSARPAASPQDVDPSDAKPAGGTDPDAGNNNAKQTVVLDMAKQTYHRPTCPILTDKGNTATKMEAVGKGYQACGICKP